MRRAAALVLMGFDRPLWTALALLGLPSAISAALPGLRFDDDIDRVLLSGSPLSRAQSGFEARFDTRPAEVAILVEADGPLTPAHLARARHLAPDLEFASGVAAVASPFAPRVPPGDRAFPDEPVLSAALGGADVAGRLAAFRARGSGLPVPIDGDALLIAATVDTAARARLSPPRRADARSRGGHAALRRRRARADALASDAGGVRQTKPSSSARARRA